MLPPLKDWLLIDHQLPKVQASPSLLQVNRPPTSKECNATCAPYSSSVVDRRFNWRIDHQNALERLEPPRYVSEATGEAISFLLAARTKKPPKQAPGALTMPGWRRASRAAAVFRACQRLSFVSGDDVRGSAAEDSAPTRLTAHRRNAPSSIPRVRSGSW